MTSKSTEAQERVIPVEFTERMASLFLICIDGLRSQIPNDEPLNLELDKLSQVINKVVSCNKLTDLGREIEAHFKGKTLENEFHETENQATKSIVLVMANALKEVLTDIGSFDQTLDQCIDDISDATDLKEITAIKDRIFLAVKKSKSKTQAIKKDLETSQSAVLRLSKKLEQSQSRAVVDSLTKILNRSAYDMRIGQVVQDFQKTKNPACLIVCDVDHFRIFNDTHGHSAGDKVLCSTASTMKNSIGDSDQIFRYGGEEFVVLLYGVSVEKGVKVAEKIRSEVKRDFFVHKDKELKVTISVGVAFLQEGDTATSVFERADKAAYEAKRKGRDRVEVSPAMGIYPR